MRARRFFRRYPLAFVGSLWYAAGRMLIVRASMLPGYADCARRAAAKQWPRLLREAGFEIRQLGPSIGAAVGTAVHAAHEEILRFRMANPAGYPDVEGSIRCATTKLREEIATGAIWDASSPNLGVAELQIGRMVRATLAHLLTLEPAAVELPLRADLGDGWEMTGHVDVITVGCHLDDFKTGSVRRPYQAQLGGYALLARANGWTVSTVGITWVPRGRQNRPQPPPERQVYDAAASERAAWGIAQAIKRDVGEFRRTSAPEAFVANPMSMMCSQRYCPAWGTEWCRMHLPTEAQHLVD